MFECLSSVTLALSNHLRNMTKPMIHRWVGSQDLSKPRVPELSWGAQGDDTLSSQEGKVFQFWKLRNIHPRNTVQNSTFFHVLLLFSWVATSFTKRRWNFMSETRQPFVDFRLLASHEMDHCVAIWIFFLRKCWVTLVTVMHFWVSKVGRQDIFQLF